MPNDQPAVLATTFDAVDEAIVLSDESKAITSWNEGATRVYGYTEDEAHGRDVVGLLSLDESLWEKALRGTPLATTEFSSRRKDGLVVTVSVTLAPIRHDGEVVGVASISRDISERRRTDDALTAARRELERKNDRLARLNTELEYFAHVASHDLSEPLRAVAGMVDLLGRRYTGKFDADADEFIEFAIDGCARMKAMIDDLLAYARVGRSSGRRTSVDVAVLVSDVLAALDLAIAESGADISIGDLPTIVAEPTELTHVLQNLIGNAVKFRRPGTAPKIEVSAERNGMAWRFCIADDGIGIDPHDVTRIFRMFQRLHTQEEFAGTGIGLAIAERIVTDLGGRLWVEDRRTGGSRFCFTVPDLTADLPG